MPYELITILGPTASGKTTVATQLAARMGGEIISADSRQVYRGMDIGTGKDLAEYTVGEKAIPYHLIDIVDAGYRYSVYEFQRDFRQAFADICSRKKTPILCGGSGMYIDAAVNGYSLPEVPPNHELRAELELLSDEELAAKLLSLKALHNRSDVDTRKRTIRAIEIALHEQQTPTTDFQPIKNVYIGISVDREARRARITERLHARLRSGMVQEVEKLLASGIPAENLEYYGLEYKFLTEYITGKLQYNEMVQQLNVAIHQFAKRQMTWFRHMERKGAVIHWIDGFLPVEEKLEKITSIING
ncbi:MAG: tRNA (adenosine(37)-N6)-dimethylallyltransferase MiaA [Prevotellaceae bacterium]|jgi:tRNA dimethylallyltransferase|nr:tRNA (adenosine(37)-N6)-dimethylallyltransferase MiaA [Prevotellaceae bacterium]